MDSALSALLRGGEPSGPTVRVCPVKRTNRGGEVSAEDPVIASNPHRAELPVESTVGRSRETRPSPRQPVRLSGVAPNRGPRIADVGGLSRAASWCSGILVSGGIGGAARQETRVRSNPSPAEVILPARERSHHEDVVADVEQPVRLAVEGDVHDSSLPSGAENRVQAAGMMSCRSMIK